MGWKIARILVRERSPSLTRHNVFVQGTGGEEERGREIEGGGREQGGRDRIDRKGMRQDSI